MYIYDISSLRFNHCALVDYNVIGNTWLLKMLVGVSTTCHTQYT